MNTKQKKNWWIDAGLFVGMIVCFYLDLTGIELHQWLGVLGGALAVYHLIVHWDWVAAVSQRFFGRTSGKSRLYYVLDGLIFGGFGVITLTGLVISTWLNLSLSNYTEWLQVHIWSSIITLLVTVLKIALHWRWVVSATRSVLSPEPLTPEPVAPRQLAPVKVQASGRQMTRAEFLKVMGAVGVTSVMALTSAGSALKLLGGLEETTASAQPDTTGNMSATAATSSSSSVASNTSQPTATPSAASTTESSSQSSSVSSTTDTSSQTSNTACSVRCNHRCAYPGQCRKYTDSNNNGRCDLGECA